MEAGDVVLNVTFLSPVEAQDIIRLSFPFAYVYIDVWTKDGNPHSVQLYSEAASSLVTIRNDTMRWDTTETQSAIYHELAKYTALRMERWEVVENGVLYFAMPKATNPTWQIGPFTDVRQGFLENGELANTGDTDFRAAMVADYPVLAFAVDLGDIQATSEQVVWALGHVRDTLLSGAGKSIGVDTRTSYFWSHYPSIGDAITAFLDDFPAARARAEEFDRKLMDEAGAVSSQYADLVALSVRQTVASIEVTLPQRFGRSEWNTTDVQAYMRDTGFSKRGNPVETIYAAMPALLYLNPSLLKLLLKPLLMYQSSSKYQNPYASPDLGNDYIFSTGNNSDTSRLAIESCSSMLIMSLAHAIRTEDYTLINDHAQLLQKWADYLVERGVHTKDQISADGLKDDGLTNLALKSILGIHAMGKIREIVDPDGATSEAAKRYLVFESHEQFYKAKLDSAHQTGWGLPYDSLDPTLMKSHWTLFTAASVSDSAVRDTLIERVHRRTFWRGTAAAFGTTWNVDTGASIPLGGRNSPAQGAMFSLLAAKAFQKGGSNENWHKDREEGKKNVGAIAGGVVGGVVGLLLVAAILFLWKRRMGPFKPSEPRTRYLVNVSPRSSLNESVSSPHSQPATSTHRQEYTESTAPSELRPVPFIPALLGGGNASRTSVTSATVHESDNDGLPASKEVMMRERTLRLANANPPPASSYTRTTPSSPSVPPSINPPSSITPHSPSSVPSEEQQRQLQLQREVEELRREVNLLRAERESTQGSQSNMTPIDYRASTPSEPPPTYYS
ncbi:glutaminase [Coprinopsis cinerea okayama7|uniref:Glutaminase n=1 Tax=Coprinopsis cinerea (strain Okayama-7 / 130 / ATCC MYA-4618 / FGSC 9003) TaxID=240176 RepID=A8N0A4_COPC7|nr:glutaminase [Coprinopsis cinerea okayama7\|eukprot:XP_001828292.2 glutaminase [Coprinopsis cinerea okayama7\